MATALVAAALSIGATAPSAQAASAYQQVLHAYEQGASIPPCRFSGATLAAALKGVDSYGAQYFADFTQAVNDALSIRAEGACSASVRRDRGGAGARAQGRSGPGVGIPPHMTALTAATGGSVPAPLLLLGVLAAAGAVAAGVAVGVRTRRR
jgi:hypothetical protein